MNNKAFNVSLSLTDNNIKIVRGLVQYDDANLFNIQVLSNGEAFDFTGYTDIVLAIRKPDGTSVITELTEEGDTVQIIDAETGMISMQLGGQATVLPGMHFATIGFYGDGMKATTAKMNYFVAEAIDFESDIQSDDDWPILDQLIAQNSLIAAAEEARILAEQARITAEEARASNNTGLISTATTLSNLAQQYAEMARNWAAVALATCIPGDYWNFVIVEEDGKSNLYIEYDDELYPDGYTLPVLTQEQLEARLAAIDCGVFNEPVDKIQILGGLLEDIPALSERELGFATDTKEMYIGTAEGNQVLNIPGFVAQATEPTNTGILWIDTANGNVIKFYNGTAWVATAAATFS